MPVPDPCCGMSLQKATRILAIIEIVLAVCTVIIGIIAVAGVVAAKDTINKDHPDVSYGAVVAFVVIYFLIGIFELIMSIILLLGANNRDLTKCRIWFVVAVALMAVSVAVLIGNFVATSVAAGSVSSAVISILIRGYCCWVVLAFMSELKGVNVPT